MERPQDIAGRIANELAALAREAQAVHLDTLHYLIEMARMEAERSADAP